MIIFLYILKDYLKFVLGTIALCLFLFIMFDFIHKTTGYFSKYEPETRHIIALYVYQIPAQTVQALPIASLLASVICMVLMSRTNEITAMRAAGMGPLMIGAPVAFGGALLSIASIIIGEFVVPYTSERMHFVEKILIEKEDDMKMAQGSRWVRDQNRLYHFRDYDLLTQTLIGIKILTLDGQFRPRHTLLATSARYDLGAKQWKLNNVSSQSFQESGALTRFEKLEAMLLPLPVEPHKLKKERRTPGEMSLAELSESVRRGEASGADVSIYNVDFHIKLAFHFAAFVVSLIGIKFAYRSERSVESAKSIALAFALGMSYWFILNAGRALGKQGILPAVFASWLANLVIFAIGSIQIWRTRRG